MVLREEIRSSRQVCEGGAGNGDSEIVVRCAVGVTDKGGAGITSGICTEPLPVYSGNGQADS